MKKNSLILFCLFNLMCFYIFAGEINIVEVRRNIPLSDDEAVYKDFYLNAGEGSGLKKNQVVKVKRKIYVKDNAAKSVGDFETQVGELKVIQVDSKMTIAREFKLTARDEEPMLEQIGIMSGDRIDLTSAFIDNSKPLLKKKVSETSLNEGPNRLPAESAPPAQPVDKLISPLKAATPPATPEI
jgi:hypothetical protein